MRLDTIRSSSFAEAGRPSAPALLGLARAALACAALACAATGLGACVGSGAQVASSHPAAVSASATPLPVVATALTSEEDVAAEPATDHAGHAGHMGHGGHTGHGGGHAH